MFYKMCQGCLKMCSTNTFSCLGEQECMANKKSLSSLQWNLKKDIYSKIWVVQIDHDVQKQYKVEIILFFWFSWLLAGIYKPWKLYFYYYQYHLLCTTVININQLINLFKISNVATVTIKAKSINLHIFSTTVVHKWHFFPNVMYTLFCSSYCYVCLFIATFGQWDAYFLSSVVSDQR